MSVIFSHRPAQTPCRRILPRSAKHVMRTLFSPDLAKALSLKISDSGPAFRSRELGAFLSRCGVRQTFSSPYSPQTCGLVGRHEPDGEGCRPVCSPGAGAALILPPPFPRRVSGDPSPVVCGERLLRESRRCF